MVANALAAASVDLKPAIIAWRQAFISTASLTGDVTKPTPKKVLKKLCMNAARSVFICSVISSSCGLRHAVRVVVGLEQIRHDGACEHGLADAVLALLGEEARDLAAAHREADQRNFLLDSGVVEHRRDIIGIGIVIVSVPGLVRAAEAAAVGKMQRWPASTSLNAAASQVSAVSGQPWSRTTGSPRPQSL